MPYLNDPQCDFIDLPHKYRAFVGGYGSGKTWVGCAGLCKHALEHPGIDAGYFAPTYPQIRDIFYPTIEEVADTFGLGTKIMVSEKEVKVFTRRVQRSKIICRSMDNPASIVGFKIGHALVDEIDTMAEDKARAAWRKIIARMRYKKEGLRNGVDVTTTPEGFKFTHSQWVKEPGLKPELRDLYGMVQASTVENAGNLPDDYIRSLRESYPAQLIDAYLNGEFVNLASGSVYPEFDRRKNHTDATLQDGEAIHAGLDFNVLNMTAIISVIREGLPVTVAELTGVRDTPTMARMLVERYVGKGHAIVVYPDASGGNTSSKDAAESDLTILRKAGLTIRVNNANPAVKDRVNAVNAMILNGEGERRWKINTDACPSLTEALEQQAYDKNSEPDKTTGHDHANDAAGYFFVNRWPIVKRIASVEPLRL